MKMETIDNIGRALFWIVVGLLIQSASVSVTGWWAVRNSDWECTDYQLELYGVAPQLSCNEYARRVNE